MVRGRAAGHSAETSRSARERRRWRAGHSGRIAIGNGKVGEQPLEGLAHLTRRVMEGIGNVERLKRGVPAVKDAGAPAPQVPRRTAGETPHPPRPAKRPIRLSTRRTAAPKTDPPARRKQCTGRARAESLPERLRAQRSSGTGRWPRGR